MNGIAFAGDYLSAASFLGICGMIAVSGYDGFLYSIGYLAGWVVALFVVAEPMRRLGRYTFTDALDAKFNKRKIKLFAAIATLIVSIFYLIPQMVGAGVLIEPLLGFPQWVGVVLVGAIVITIVATAGMTSTTYVQFIKGSLLILFTLIIVVALLVRGFSTEPDQGGRVPFYHYKTITATQTGDTVTPDDPAYQVVGQQEVTVKDKTLTFVKLQQGNTRHLVEGRHRRHRRDPPREPGTGPQGGRHEVHQRRSGLRRQQAAAGQPHERHRRRHGHAKRDR